jgi:hypothetical protein
MLLSQLYERFNLRIFWLELFGVIILFSKSEDDILISNFLIPQVQFLFSYQELQDFTTQFQKLLQFQVCSQIQFSILQDFILFTQIFHSLWVQELHFIAHLLFSFSYQLLQLITLQLHQELFWKVSCHCQFSI